jgi:predicted nucleic acid-binding protein
MNNAVTVDASVVMAVVLNEPARSRLIELTAGAELISAPTLPWEVGNAFSAMLRRRRIDLPTVEAAMDAVDAIGVRLVGGSVRPSVELAARHDIYAYDAYVVECARRYRTPLLSLDRRQCEVARAEGVRTIELDA